MDLTGLSFDTATALSVASLVLVGLAAIWGARKALSFASK